MSAIVPLPLIPPPGVVVTETLRAVEGRWVLPCQNIRFVKGRPQKDGGNIRVTSVAMSGTPRALHAWRDFLQNQYVASGTYRKLYAFDSGYNLTDITPFSSTGSLGSNPFTTTSGSPSVTVHHVAHGRNVGDTAIYSGATPANGAVLNGTFIVQAITDANDYVINQATDTATTVLLHCDGTNGSTSFPDSSGNGFAVTANGAAAVSTVQEKFGSGSAHFVSSGDSLSIANSPSLTPAGDYTIEFWAYPTQLTGGTFYGAASKGSGLYGPYFIYVDSAGTWRFFASSNGSSWDIASNVSIGAATLNTWQHVAVVRSGNTYYTFLNGTQISTFSNSSTPATNTGPLYIGATEATLNFVGYIDEFRLSSIARWTASFTPGTVAYSLTAAATSGTGGGSSVTFEYEISVGTELGAFGLGWGVGPWGLGTWSTPRASSTIFIEPRVWSLDHFGVVLVATYNGGSIWFFDPTQSEPWPRAVSTFGGNPVVGAPTNFRAMFITPERFIFGLCDAMVVNVCSQNDPTTWTPATANTAFSRTLQIGTKLVGGRVLAPFLSMVWSDAAAYLFQYTGSQFVYNSSVAGLDCGLISPGAAVTVDGIAYWMGSDNFYMFNGSVMPMPNVEDIRKYVFDALPDSLGYQCHAVYIPKYHEIKFFYPTTGATNPTNFVTYHINDQVWTPSPALYGIGNTTGRASGTHFTQGDTSPLMAGTDGYIYNHDPVGDVFNDNGQPLVWTLTISPIAKSEGLQNLDVEGILWDFFEQNGNISATVNTYDRLTDLAPMDSETEIVPDAQAGLTDYRLGGRYLGFTLTSSDLGNYMRYGKPVAFVRPSGRRR